MNLAYIFEQGDVVLISVFLLLSAMSLISWYLIFCKAWQLRQERRIISEYGNGEATANSALALLQQQAAAIKLTNDREQNEKLLSLYLGQALDIARVSLDRGLTILASIGSSAPFIGLFGTVWGIYGALTHIAAEGNASLNVVAGPMGEALVATAIGLFAAIPAVLAYNAFLRMNRLVVQDLRHIAEQMTLHLSEPNGKK